MGLESMRTRKKLLFVDGGGGNKHHGLVLSL